MSLFGQNKPAGGLSINTGSANSLFSGNNASNTSQAPPGSLFGSSTATSKPGGLFGSSTSTAASAGTLFGASTTTTTQGGNLFGNTAAAPASNAGTLFGGAASSQGGGLFGQPKPQTSQPQQGGGLFGQSTQQQSGGLFGNTQPQQQQQQQQQQGGGMFPNAASQPQAAGSLFGQSTAQTNQAQPMGSTLFPSLNQSSNTQPAGGPFGGTQNTSSIFNNSTAQPTQNPQKPSYSTFSTLNPTQQPQRSAFSASIGQYTAAAQTIPGVRVDISNLRPTTRFEDLHDSLQKDITELDTFILNQAKLSDECASVLPRIAQLISTIPSDVDYIERKLKATQQSLETDAALIEDGRTLVKADAEDARKSFKAIHALKMPAQYHTPGLWGSSATAGAAAPGALADGEAVDAEKESADLVRYFSKQADEMGKKLEMFKKNMSEVEGYLAGVEQQTRAQVQRVRMGRGEMGPQTAEEKVRELATVLREFEGGILTVAGSVGGVREQVQEVMLNESKTSRWSGARSYGVSRY